MSLAQFFASQENIAIHCKTIIETMFLVNRFTTLGFTMQNGLSYHNFISNFTGPAFNDVYFTNDGRYSPVDIGYRVLSIDDITDYGEITESVKPPKYSANVVSIICNGANNEVIDVYATKFLRDNQIVLFIGRDERISKGLYLNMIDLSDSIFVINGIYDKIDKDAQEYIDYALNSSLKIMYSHDHAIETIKAHKFECDSKKKDIGD